MKQGGLGGSGGVHPGGGGTHFQFQVTNAYLVFQADLQTAAMAEVPEKLLASHQAQVHQFRGWSGKTGCVQGDPFKMFEQFFGGSNFGGGGGGMGGMGGMPGMGGMGGMPGMGGGMGGMAGAKPRRRGQSQARQNPKQHR